MHAKVAASVPAMPICHLIPATYLVMDEPAVRAYSTLSLHAKRIFTAFVFENEAYSPDIRLNCLEYL